MKRRGKCVGKKSFAYYGAALNSVSKQYKYFGKKMAVYECPTCLDFHLTTKYCNTTQYHRRWTIALIKEVDREYAKLNVVTLTKKRKRLSLPKQQKISKAVQERYKNQLPISKQKEIWARFDGKIYPQPNHLQRLMRSIISVWRHQ